MKFFLDTANLDELKKGAELGIVDGVTTVTSPEISAFSSNPVSSRISAASVPVSLRGGASGFVAGREGGGRSANPPHKCISGRRGGRGDFPSAAPGAVTPSGSSSSILGSPVFRFTLIVAANSADS